MPEALLDPPHLLHHVDLGAGVPLVALHGWTPDHRLMLGCLEPVLADRPGYRRLYPDLPGMGATPAWPQVAASDDVLDAVLRFVDATVGDEPFLLAGESYGGYLARAVVRSRPSQVLGLALVCPVGPPAARRLPARQVLRPDPAVLAALDPDLAREFEEIAVVQSADAARRFAEQVLPGLAVADRAALERIGQRRALSVDPDDPAHAPFERPTLLVLGRQDDVVGYADQLGLVEQYPRATVAVLDVAGHNAQLERPGVFEALVADWLDRVETEPDVPGR